MSLSNCLLARNTELTVQRVIDLVAGLGAEVIVADIGSTNGTVQAAQAHGAKVHVVDWHVNFGAAQIDALALTTGDWVLWGSIPTKGCCPEGVSKWPRSCLHPAFLRPL
jgi:hypothetical protein